MVCLSTALKSAETRPCLSMLLPTSKQTSKIRQLERHTMSTNGIIRWAFVLRSTPRRHHWAIQSSKNTSFRFYATHERASHGERLAPRVEYQATNGSTWIVSDGSVSAEKEGVALAKALSLPWAIKRVQWRKGTALIEDGRVEHTLLDSEEVVHDRRMMCVTEYCTTAKNIGLQWLPIPFKKLLMDYYHVANRKQSMSQRRISSNASPEPQMYLIPLLTLNHWPIQLPNYLGS